MPLSKICSRSHAHPCRTTCTPLLCLRDEASGACITYNVLVYCALKVKLPLEHATRNSAMFPLAVCTLALFLSTSGEGWGGSQNRDRIGRGGGFAFGLYG